MLLCVYKLRIAEVNHLNTIKRFDGFIDKVSSIVLDILSNEIDEWDDSWGIKPKVVIFSQLSDDEKWIIEQERVHAEFINSLTLEEYEDYFGWQDEVREALWKLEMAS